MFDISKVIGSFVRSKSFESYVNMFLLFELIFISELFYYHKDFNIKQISLVYYYSIF